MDEARDCDDDDVDDEKYNKVLTDDGCRCVCEGSGAVL